MTFQSIRSRLALSFAGIALVAALALGAVLLAILHNYYNNLERSYLRQNAEEVANLVAKMTSDQTPPQEVQLQIQNLAFLTQTRIEVYGEDERLLYDSGSPAGFAVRLGIVGKSVSGPVPRDGPDKPSILVITEQGNRLFTDPSELSVGGDGPGRRLFFYSTLQAQGSPFGFALNPEATDPEARSKMEFLLTVQGAAGRKSVRLSEGPAYGSAVLRSVAWGWALASAIAVLLAAAMGSYISRRISAPVLTLTRTTAKMAEGDLSSRANVNSHDELGQLARSFNEMADQVETTVTTLQRFVSDAAHELRTPLTALRTNLDLALDEHNTADRTEFLAHAQLMVKRLEELNTNLLDLSRLEANGRTIHETVIDLKELLAQRSELYASQAEQARLAFEAELPDGPIHVRADASQLLRAVDNLVDNACKFTLQDGAIRLALDEQRGQAIITVSDTGIGIPTDELQQLFNRFHRGRNANAYPGSGLGLAIVKAIVEANKGKVAVKSEGEGKGSQFSIRFSTVQPPAG